MALTQGIRHREEAGAHEHESRDQRRYTTPINGSLRPAGAPVQRRQQKHHGPDFLEAENIATDRRPNRAEEQGAAGG
jgi:hypothetical protein